MATVNAVMFSPVVTCVLSVTIVAVTLVIVVAVMSGRRRWGCNKAAHRTHRSPDCGAVYGAGEKGAERGGFVIG